MILIIFITTITSTIIISQFKFQKIILNQLMKIIKLQKINNQHKLSNNSRYKKKKRNPTNKFKGSLNKSKIQIKLRVMRKITMMMKELIQKQVLLQKSHQEEDFKGLVRNLVEVLIRQFTRVLIMKLAEKSRGMSLTCEECLSRTELG